MSASRLPPLNALRAFEAVARLQSFRKAADELFVTPAAVTHQIKALEALLGMTLFERVNRGIRLTPAAQTAWPILQEGFATLERGVAELRRHVIAEPRLIISASPTFVSRWLMPRLQGFLERYPGIDVSVVASGQVIAGLGQAPQDSRRNGPAPEPDLDIRFTGDAPSDGATDLLFAVEIMPMCHPRRLAGPAPLRIPEDLRHQTLLHGDGRLGDRSRSAWARWLHLAGVSGVDPRRGLQFEHSTLALEAAADDLGVTLAMPMLAEEELRSGAVTVAFPLALPLDSAYYVNVSESARNRPEVSAFRDWLIAEARAAVLQPLATPRRSGAKKKATW